MRARPLSVLSLLVVAALSSPLIVSCDDGDGHVQADVDAGSDAPIDSGSDVDVDTDADTVADADAVCGAGVAVVDLNTQGTAVEGGLTYSTSVASGAGTLIGSCGGDGPEIVLAFTPESDGDLVVDTFGSGYDTVLYVRTDCRDAESELACNDDADDVQSLVEVPGGATAGETLYIVADAYGEDAGALMITARVRARVPVGDPCDPAGPTSQCVQGAYCGGDATCVAGTAPALDAADAYTIDSEAVYLASTGEEERFYFVHEEGETFRLVASGSDAEGDVALFLVTFLDEDGEAISLDYYDDEPEVAFRPTMEGDTEFVGSFTGDALFLTEYPEIAGLRLTLVDATELGSDPIEATLVDLPRPEIGADCDADGLYDRCAAGGVCDAELDTPVCVASTNPVLTSVAVRTIEDDHFRLTMTGTDAEGDVTHFEMTFVDDAGDDVGSGPDEATDFPFDFDWSVEGQTAFTAYADLDYAGDGVTPDGATGLRIELVDSAGNASGSLTAGFESMSEIAAGDTCDPIGAADVCVAGTLCFGEEPTCQTAESAADAICSGELPALVSGVPTTVFESPPLTYYDGLFGGDCGGPGLEQVFVLEVAEPSRVVITTDLPGSEGDTVVYVRSSCDDQGAELGCNDDEVTSTLSTLVLDDVAAGTYYVFADTFYDALTFTIMATVTAL